MNLFYEEPNTDRWLPFDRYPRAIIRRIVRGAPRPGGQMRVFLNLCAGLRRLGVSFRVNDYRYVRRRPHEIACIIGKPHVLDKADWHNPILFGTAVFSHPCDDPHLLQRLPVRRVLVPGKWVRDMFAPYFGDRVFAWPTGIDTYQWSPAPTATKDIDVLLYDKVQWEHERFEAELIEPVQRALAERGLRAVTIRYGLYREEDFQVLVRRSRSMVFLCEHETQGIAYQQVLATGVPILAWDRGGEWRDPSYYPARVRYGTVTAVPYWDRRCGLTFRCAEEFPARLDQFLTHLRAGDFSPRDYIIENLTLEKCAQDYLAHVAAVARA